MPPRRKYSSCAEAITRGEKFCKTRKTCVWTNNQCQTRPKFAYKGRQYVVREGPAGGAYILAGGNKMYLASLTKQPSVSPPKSKTPSKSPTRPKPLPKRAGVRLIQPAMTTENLGGQLDTIFSAMDQSDVKEKWVHRAYAGLKKGQPIPQNMLKRTEKWIEDNAPIYRWAMTKYDECWLMRKTKKNPTWQFAYQDTGYISTFGGDRHCDTSIEYPLATANIRSKR